MGFNVGSTIAGAAGLLVGAPPAAGGADDLSLLLMADGSKAGIFKPIGPPIPGRAIPPGGAPAYAEAYGR